MAFLMISKSSHYIDYAQIVPKGVVIFTTIIFYSLIAVLSSSVQMCWQNFKKSTPM